MRLFFSLLVSLAVSVCSVASLVNGEPRSESEISVKGKDEFKLKYDDSSSFRIKGGSFDGSVLTVPTPGKASLVKGSIPIASASTAADGTVEITDGAGAILFRVREAGETYRITSPPEQFVSRVKIKEDKFNVYDSDDKRLFHGKQKEDGFKVKDEDDELVWKIKGVSSLREASTLSVPIPPLSKILLWGAWYGSKIREK